MDRRLDEDLRLTRLRDADAATPQKMDQGLLASTRRIASIILPVLDEPDDLGARIFQESLVFIENELGLESDDQPDPSLYH